MRYQIEADWHLLNTCNYRCAYCFFPPEVLGDKMRTFAGPQEWRRAFDTTGYSWLLHLTGGEPGIYPDFAELCAALTGQHYISINSNLTHNSFDSFANKVDPSRVSFINAGFHFEERERRSGNAIFLKTVDLLSSRNFPVLVSLVATPSILARFDRAIAVLEPTGFFPIPKVLRGFHDGKRYPEAYTELDKARFRTYAGLARNHYEPILFGMAERPSLDMFKDDELLEGEPSFLGQSCEAGHLFVRVDPGGEVFRCGSSSSFGNILSGTFVRRTGPAACDTSHCVYFCKKYTQSALAPVSSIHAD
jgi:MoaA/NifB/PqqE/SkfB family radical SAM enzyme